MSEQELDLLKLSACLVAQSGTGTSEIVRRNAIQTTFRGPGLYDAPYDFRTETACRDPTGLVDRPKNRAGRDASGGQPVIDRKLDPARDWHRSNVTTLANKIGDDPVLFSLLDFFDGEPRHLRPSEATTEQNRDHCVVAFGTQVFTAERGEESLPLVRRQPIPDAHAMLLYALDPPDSRRKIGAQKAAVGSFVRQSPNRCKAQVDRGRGILGLFEIDPVACHHRLVERKARFGAVPVDKFTNRVIVGSLRAAGGQAVEDGGFRLFEIRQFQDGFRSELAFFVSHSCSLHDTARRVQSTLARL